MAFIGRVFGKIQTRKLKNGLSHNFLLVHKRRCFMTGKVVADIVSNFGSVRNYQLESKRQVIWSRIDEVLARLTADGSITTNDAIRAKEKFAELLGNPKLKQSHTDEVL